VYQLPHKKVGWRKYLGSYCVVEWIDAFDRVTTRYATQFEKPVTKRSNGYLERLQSIPDYLVLIQETEVETDYIEYVAVPIAWIKKIRRIG